MPKITITLEVDAEQAQYLAALIHCWSIDVTENSSFYERPLALLNDFILDLAFHLWSEETGLFSGGVDGGAISHEFYNLHENGKDVQSLWAFRNVVIKTPHWVTVKDRLQELTKPNSTI